MTKTTETIVAALKEIAAAKKARSKRFHEELDKMYEVKRADIKALREKEAKLLAELKAAKSAKPEAKKAEAKAPEAVAA